MRPKCLEIAPQVFAEFEFLLEHAGHSCLRGVIFGRPQAARRYHGSRSRKSGAHGTCNCAGHIANGRFSNYAETNRLECTGDVRGICIDCRAAQQLLADRDDLDFTKLSHPI